MAHTPDTPLARDILDRFCRYVQVHTTSQAGLDYRPSSPGQNEFLDLLEAELEELGVRDRTRLEAGYLVARVPARGRAEAPTVAFLAHVDTSPDASGEGVRPVVIDRYDGSTIRPDGPNPLDPAEFPILARYTGTTVITSDGRTLLGADDKAGVAAIMAATRVLVSDPPFEHGPVEMIFTTDEEIGTGMDAFPVDQIRARAAYTVDGEGEGELETACFNAASVRVTFTGSVIHPGYARGKLGNAVTAAGLFLAMLPRSESPEATDGPFGFYCPTGVEGRMAESRVNLIIRDFQRSEVDRRLAAVRSIADAVCAAVPGVSAEITVTEQYRNMSEVMDRHPRVTELAMQAIRETGMEPLEKSIRGGTDGARLSFMGVPTPNLFSGAQNMHGPREWVALPAMERAARVVLNLVRLWSDEPAEPEG